MASVATILLLGAAAALALASASPATAEQSAGETVFRKCRVCHAVEAGKNKVGPSLHGVVGRVPGTVDGYRYSEAMKRFGDGRTWTVEALKEYLENPRDVVKGTKMAFPGLKDPQDRDAVVEYLKQQAP